MSGKEKEKSSLKKSERKRWKIRFPFRRIEIKEKAKAQQSIAVHSGQKPATAAMRDVGGHEKEK